MSQVAHQASAYVRFQYNEATGSISTLPLDSMLDRHRVSTQHFSRRYLLIHVGEVTVKVKCFAQEHQNRLKARKILQILTKRKSLFGYPC